MGRGVAAPISTSHEGGSSVAWRCGIDSSEKTALTFYTKIHDPIGQQPFRDVTLEPPSSSAS